MAIGFPTKANWAAGDVLTASALDDLAGTVNLLSNASAASGSQLVSNAAGTSFAYQATPSASNPVLNSSFQVFQRSSTPTTGITVTSGNAYTLDRWNSWTISAGGSVTTSQQLTADTTNLPFIQYAARFQRVAGNTNTGSLVLGQPLETVNSRPFAGKTVTISFYGRAGANYSPASNALVFQLWQNTTTDVSLQTVQSGSTNAVNGNATLTTTWQRFSFTGTVASTTTQLAPAFLATPTGTAGTNGYFEVTGVQIDIGSVALPFRTYAGTIQGELAACQRYYTRVLASSGNNYYYYAPGVAKSTTVAKIVYTMPVTMRVVASVPEYSALSLYDTVNAPINVTAITTDIPTLNNFSMDITVASGLTQYRPYFLFANNQSGGYFGLTAEL